MTLRITGFATGALLWLGLFAGGAIAQALPAFKDNLFAYPGLLADADGGAYRVVAYDKMRDIHQRDETPERRVHGKYISTGVRRLQQDLVAKTPAGDVRHFAVGNAQDARLIVVYLHGQGGSRKQGVDDFTFGGNFNRIKNLTAMAGGVYLSPDIVDFGERGADQISALISLYATAAPRAPVFIACGSAGGALCWRLARDGEVAKRLGGLLLLGSLWDESFLSSAAFKRKVPVLLAQGSQDPVFPVEKMEQFYRIIGARSPAYPVRMVRFETGSHGTPIRMVDWRETINWMISTPR
jgi:pimeloyl-ACP methyl ester carboxylesterase